MIKPDKHPFFAVITRIPPPVQIKKPASLDAVVACLLAWQADVNIPNEHDHTVLHNAVKQDRFNIVKMLLNAHADTNARNHWGETPSPLQGEVNPLGETIQILQAYGAH